MLALIEGGSRSCSRGLRARQVGAKIVDSMRDANIILGVKEVPIKKLEENKTYMIFSHTHKGQKYNMPALQTVLDRRIRLMDYELLTDAKGRRLVRFGTFAGYAGMVDFLHGLGLRLLALGYDSPFLVRRAQAGEGLYGCAADTSLGLNTRTLA